MVDESSIPPAIAVVLDGARLRCAAALGLAGIVYPMIAFTLPGLDRWSQGFLLAIALVWVAWSARALVHLERARWALATRPHDIVAIEVRRARMQLSWGREMALAIRLRDGTRAIVALSRRAVERVTDEAEVLTRSRHRQ